MEIRPLFTPPQTENGSHRPGPLMFHTKTASRTRPMSSSPMPLVLQSPKRYRPPLDITKPQSTVPIMMCDDCMGWRVAFEFANARGSDQAPQLKGLADDAFNTIKMGSTQRRQRQNLRRQPYNRRGSFGGWGVPTR